MLSTGPGSTAFATETAKHSLATAASSAVHGQLVARAQVHTGYCRSASGSSSREVRIRVPFFCGLS